MNEPDFEYLRTFLKVRSGLALPQEKRYLVESRLATICRSFGVADLTELVKAIRGGRNLTLENAVIEAMTTNETFFFRDKGPFDLFKDVLLPRYLNARSNVRHLRIWCAAASTGQEPYSLAMLLEEAAPRLIGWKVDILATDISNDVLAKARAGLYNQFEVQRGLPIQLLLKHFTQVGDQWQISSKMRAKVDFQQLNLIKDFRHFGTFDIIYCRNVLIYFDTPTKGDVLKRLSNVMAPDGSLILGAAETVLGLTDAFLPDATHRGLYGKSMAKVEQKPLSPVLAMSR
jgi:Methylase of chemotaxis methyl-accepting proteins